MIEDYKTPKAVSQYVTNNRMDGTTNVLFKVPKALNDIDIMQSLKKHSKYYYVSAYDVVQEPDIVLRNREFTK